MTYLLIFVLSIILSAPYLIDICSGYLNYQGFDLQEFLLWHYTSFDKYIPYRDIFYPYGFLSYFKNYNFAYSVTYYLVVPILLTITFFIFKKIFKDKFALYFSFFMFYLFILILVGFQTFSRYGILVVFSLYFSYMLYSAKKLKINTLFFFGIILGLVCSFVFDQGIYLFFSFIFMYFLSKYIFLKKQHFVVELLYVFLGFFIGVIPLLFFLFIVGNFNILSDYVNDIKEIIVIAKVSFFSFINSPANIFTILILYFSIFYNFLKFFIFKDRFSLSSFLQLSLILSIAVMEYKSIMRSIDRQITFVSVVLLMLLAYEVINRLKNKVIYKRIFYFSLIFLAIILYSLNVNRQSFHLSSLFNNYNFLVSNRCFSHNLNYFSKKNPSYIEIVNLIKDQANFNGKIFSFPTGDSAFYVLLKQRPPFYNSIFEGSSYDKQQSTVKYIQDNKIGYVTLNTSLSSLQDGVPDYIRQSLLFKYILNNYYPFETIGKHLILRKEKNNDFFAAEALDKVKDYRNYLMNVDLKKIPYSEGLYKYNFFNKNNKLIIKSEDIKEINSLLEKETFYSDNKVFVLIPNIDYKKGDLSYIKFVTNNGDSNIFYYPCKKNSKCIINLSNIPIFYRERTITRIILDGNFRGNMEIYDLKEQGKLW